MDLGVLPVRDGEGQPAALVWIVVAFLVAGITWYLVPGDDVDVVDAALTTALTVIAPYGLLRVVPTPKWRDDLVQRQTPAEMAFLGALAVIVSTQWPDFAATAFLLLWLVPTAGLLAASLRLLGWLPGRRRPWDLADVVALVAQGWLVAGAAWLVIHRAGWQPLGLDLRIIELTAVHFHYAGFAATVIARETWLATREQAPRLGLLALSATLAGPPVVAAGFSTSVVLLPVGAALLTTGLWCTAWLTVRHVAPRARQAPRVLLLASSAAVLAPMVLATQWAIGNVTDVPALSIPQMAAFHGATNAIGFSLLGLLGWHLHKMEPKTS